MRNRGLVLLILSLLLLSINLSAFQGTAFQLSIPEPMLENGAFNNQLPQMLNPGTPAIPYFPVRILVPMGEVVDELFVTNLNSQIITSDVPIPHIPMMQPISEAFKLADPGKNLDIYNSNEFYPYNDYELLGTQFMNGYQILLVNLYPYKYNPVSNEVSWSEEMLIEYSSHYDATMKEQQNRFLLNDNRSVPKLNELVINPQEIHSYNKTAMRNNRDLPDFDSPYSMVIITTNEALNYFDEFIIWKNAQGISTGIFTTEEIFAVYPGRDDQEKVRNFVIDAYATYSDTDTPLEYVLLGGDDELVPERGAYGAVGNYIDYGIPCDMYYGNLDGDWDANANNVFGEFDDNNDLIPEVAVGRITCETEQEFQNFFQKNYTYVDESNVSNDVVYFIGENLNNNPLTWGGDYTDEIEQYLENGFHLFRLYERDGTYSSSNVCDAINSGLSIINHMGHANQNIVMGQTLGSLSSYNNSEFGFAYSQGCYPAAFDEGTSGGSESIAENLILSPHALYAFVGNTRYGWYAPGSTDGASQFFSREFFQGMFQHNQRQLGKANNYSKIQLVNSASSSSVMRWCFYELSVLGDPSVMVKSPLGSFPYIQPLSSSFDDFQGDGDGMVNPGETININVILENLEGWCNAGDVYAKISFENENVELVQDSVYYGTIESGEAEMGEGSFIINVPESCGYESINYNLQVIAPVSENTNFERNYTLNFDISLFQANWPWHADGSVVSNPAIYDLDNDMYMEAVIAKTDASIYLLNADAELLPGWPFTQDEYLWRSFAIADLDGDGSVDFIFASRNGRILAVNQNSEIILDYQNCNDQLLTPIVTDLDNDGVQDIISYGIDTNIYVISANGELQNGFPYSTGSTTSSEMAVADINEDGTAEIIFVGVNGTVHAISSSGTELNGFPIDLGSPIFGAPIILDNKKIVCATNSNEVFIISPTGEILSQTEISGRVANSPIAADFNNDGELDIAFATTNGWVSIINQDGSTHSGWPVQLQQQVINPPLAADFDNDGNVDLAVLGSISDVFMFHNDGTSFEFAPVPIGFTGNTPASIGDLDSDGDWDIIAGTSFGAFVVDPKLPKGEKIPWRTYRGNYRRTAYFGDNELTELIDQTPELPHYLLKQNYPNPFNPTTKISFSLENSENVKIDIFNVKGQKVKSLLNKEMNSGEHTISWNGVDDRNKKVSSGIYFYKMEAAKFSKVKKMILLK